MAKPKRIETVKVGELSTGESVYVDRKSALKMFLNKRLPSMFDRDPVITGDVGRLAEEIINLLK